MQQDIIDRVIRQLIEAGLADPAAIAGCSEEEIAQIEKHFAVTLPGVYKQFLRKMGKQAGVFLQGTDLYFPLILKLRQYADELLTSSSTKFQLAKTDFVFCVHQGYQFLYFNAQESDDPSVHYYLEDEPAPKKVFDHFSAWLRTTVTDEIEANK